MSITILPRSAWTDTAPGFARFPARRLDPNAVRTVAPHYPADGAVTYGPNPTLAQSAARLRAYRNYHVNHLGWADIGYPMGIDQAGRIFTLAGLSFAGAHSASPGFPDANYRVTAVLFIIGNNEEPSAKAIASFRNLCRWMKENRYPNLANRPVDHGNLRGASTSCAGPALRRILPTGRMDIPTGKVTAPATPATGGIRLHSVKSGETLSAIAGRYSVTVGTLATANRLANPNLLSVGQKLTIPGGETAKPTPAKPAATRPAASPAGSYADRTRWPERPIQQRLNDQLWEDNAYESTKFALVEALRRAGYGTDSTTAWGRLQQISRWLRGRHNMTGPETQVEIWKRFQTFLKSVNRYDGAIDGIPGPQTTQAIFGWLNDIRTSYL